jgi:2'-5' RNA ligase
MLRLFACIWVPNDLRDKIIKFQKEVQKLPLGTKFVEPENLHITVTFLGDVKEDKLNSIISKLDYITKTTKKFSVRLMGLKVIPNESCVRVLGINLMDGENVVDLIKKIGASIGGKYYEEAKLTLCRVKKIQDKHSLREFIERNRNIEIGGFEVRSVALVNSVLTRSGPIYKTVHESTLL